VGPPLVAALPLRALFGPGYLLQVDVAFGPRIAPVQWTFYAPVSVALHAVQWAIGGALTGRIYAFLGLAICGFGAMVLVRDKRWWIQCAVGVLAMLNPFVYDRLVEGQWSVLVATGGLFLFVAAWLALQRRPTVRTAAATAGAGLLTVVFSANFVGILLVTAIGLSIAATRWREPVQRRLTLAALISIAVLSTYGVIPFFINHSGTTYATYKTVTTFSAADFAAFRATPDPHFGVFAALAGVYGEWSERIGRFVVADFEFPWAILATIVLVGLAIAGALLTASRAWFVLLGAAGIVVSGSTAVTWGRQAVLTLAQHIPIVAAYREPQKWDVLWLVALVVLGAEGIERLGSLAARRLGRREVGPPLAALMVAASIAPAGFVELRDTASVVTPVSYPASWDRGAAYLQSHVPADSPVVVLPWHLYETLPFVGRPTENPADVFFPGRLVISNDPELPGTLPADPIGSGAVQPEGCALAQAVRASGIRWALVIPGAPAGALNEAALERCGFRAAFGSGTELVVLQDAGARAG